MSLSIRRYGHAGRGVYSNKPIARRQIVEVAPVIVLNKDDWKKIKGTRLEAYVFEWGRTGNLNAVPLGYGGLFNHSDKPNLEFHLNRRKHTITFRALRDIPAGEQLTIDYGWTDRDKRRWLPPNPRK